MSHIKSKDTKCEILLRKALWRNGIRYRKNFSALPGKPDIAITRAKIAIFVDGDFWHGHGYEIPGTQVGTNKKFWIKKLTDNKKRDEEVNDLLTEEGWMVIRFWESEVISDLEKCLRQVIELVPKKMI